MEIWVNAATRASALTVWGWHSCHWWHVHGDLCCQRMVCGLFWLDFWIARDTTPRHKQWCISVLSMSNLLCSWGGSVKSCTFPGGLQSGTSPYTVRAIGLWGSLHHKRGCRSLWCFPSFKNKKETNARKYFHCSFDATTTTNHPTPKDAFIRNISVSELKSHPVKLKMAFIFLQVFYDTKHPFQWQCPK